MEELRANVAAILADPAPPSFENTVKALELAQPLLHRVMDVFSNMTSTDTNEALKALRLDILPRLTREYDAIALDDELFRRIQAVWDRREELGLDEQDARLLELTHRGFVRAGAALDAGAKARLKEVNATLTELAAKFAQNALADTKDFELAVEDDADLSGLPADFVQAAGKSAAAKGKPGAWIFGLDRSSFETFMTFADHRELRRRLFDGYRRRGACGGETDNRELVRRIVQLRAQRARLLGYETHAHYQLEVNMAKTPERAEELLLDVWARGLDRARHELAEMQVIVDEEGHDFTIRGWDWWYYAEKLRKKKYDFDETELQPYFSLEGVRRGAFYVAGQLFGVNFEPLEGVPVWSPGVTAYEVLDSGGAHVGVFMTDDYARDSKRGGAWMNNYREASSVDGREIRPIVINCMNLVEPAEGAPALLRFDEVETLFHEFGHGLHGLLTRARYERFSGTAASPRDFVELPSQFLEHYAVEPEVLLVYAKHHETGEVIPRHLVEKLRRARTHNQGFKTVEYVAAALLDMAWHTLSVEEAAAVEDTRAFERKVLAEHGMIDEIEPRYRSPYFTHIFSSGYSAGYYAYLWSEILDADGFAAFKETGDVFDPELAERLGTHVYRAGYVAPGDVLYRRFRGADPSIEPLLEMRGFLEPETLGVPGAL